VSSQPGLDTSFAMPRDYLRPCLLLALAEDTAHGYELLDRVAELGLAKVDPGRLYRCLRVMDAEGLIESHWEPSTLGPARRTYTVTEAGRESLDEAAALLEQVAQAIEAFHRRHRRASGRRST